MENNPSQRYRKFLYEVSFGSKKRIFIWGNDMTTRNEDNFLLVNDEGKVVTFERIEDIISQSKILIRQLPDKKNSKPWLKEISNIEIDGHFDFEIFSKNIFEIFSTTDNAKQFIDCLNLVTDYIDQVKDERLNEFAKSWSIKTYFNYAYSNFFWRRKNKKVTKLDLKIRNTGSSRNLVRLKSLFSTRFHFE